MSAAMEAVLGEEWFTGSGHFPDALTIGANGEAIAEVWMRGHPEVEAARRDLMVNARRMVLLLRQIVDHGHGAECGCFAEAKALLAELGA